MFRSREDELEARIKELEEGSCRFNCRTRKEAFMAGWHRFAAQAKIMNSNEEVQKAADRAYKEWSENN